MKDAAGMYVHEYEGRWVVAQRKGGQYIAPHNADACKLTGCTASFGSLAYVYGGNIYHYGRRADALRQARLLYGTECWECGKLFVGGLMGATLCPECGHWHWTPDARQYVCVGDDGIYECACGTDVSDAFRSGLPSRQEGGK